MPRLAVNRAGGAGHGTPLCEPNRDGSTQTLSLVMLEFVQSQWSSGGHQQRVLAEFGVRR